MLKSLRARLLAFLLAAIVLAGGVQAVVTYRTALKEADAIFDYHMQQMALSLRAGLPPSATVQGLGDGEQNFEFIVQVWSLDGRRIFESAEDALLPQLAVLGFTEVQARGTQYRVFSMQTRGQVIQVAQDLAPRRRMAGALAWRTVAPVALMAPLLMLVVGGVVGSALRPVARVRAQVAARQPDDLSPVSGEGLPEEVAPLVEELNLLFARVRSAFEAQQHFVADAAHELRSPLAALKLQVQGLRRAGDEAAREQAVQRLNAGIDRATRLVEQLLVLARQEAQATGGAAPAAVDLQALVREAVEEALPGARARRIDLGVAQADARVLPAHAEALRMLLRNLIDNALKYTPEGGQVDVSLQALPDGGARLAVQDSGPGLPPAERERVLDRFYRAPGSTPGGSGLGLAIVRAVAQWHGASLQLDEAPALGGLRVRVDLPG
ncbi:ATP-binding protein [Xenophilus sp. Marseille-Q4582]|uniref:ATP-binding protein n=1 Tax=Xenophilus sp. Marseille-Q4582 TaxID=2866600 RepID=UPI001CE3DF8C|nr:ATP-binding protein [Xenophilus sp. Marseille-Q4582]